MKVADIDKVLDKTWKVRMNGKNITPLFVGASGIGKSQVVLAWAQKMKKQYPDFGVVDLRLARLDSADFTGLPFKNEKEETTEFLPPNFLPKSGYGIFFLDELNRGNTSVTNCVMQLLTERSIGEYHLPDGWIIATAVNPSDSDSYDVNTMDAALLNRLVPYNVKFDHKTFVDDGQKKEWSKTVLSYLRSGQWVYKEPGQGDGIYISPRSWEYLSDDELAGGIDDPDLHHETCVALLGKNIGLDYWNFCHKTKPVTYTELERDFLSINKDKGKIKDMNSYKDFEKYGNPKKAGSYRADLLQASFQSFVDKGKAVDEDILVAILDIMPVDQSAALLHTLSFKHDSPADWLLGMKGRHSDSFARIRTVTKRKKDEDATNTQQP